MYTDRWDFIVVAIAVQPLISTRQFLAHPPFSPLNRVWRVASQDGLLPMKGHPDTLFLNLEQQQVLETKWEKHFLILGTQP